MSENDADADAEAKVTGEACCAANAVVVDQDDTNADADSPLLPSISSEGGGSAAAQPSYYNNNNKNNNSVLGFFQRMDPRQCGCTGLPSMSSSSGRSLLQLRRQESLRDKQISSLLGDVQFGSTPAKQVEALQKLYDLTDSEHKQNRIPLVATSRWQVLSVLATCLTNKNNDELCRLACLTLNNLSIPYENKAILVLGADADLVLSGLLDVLEQGRPEAYLACSCLHNLSVLEEAQDVLLEFQNNNKKQTNHNSNSSNNNDKKSLLHIVEHLLTRYEPFLYPPPQRRRAPLRRRSPPMSVQGEAVRWGMGLVRQLTSRQAGAEKIATATDLPNLVLSILQQTPKPIHDWTEDSLEDFCLLVIVHLAQWPRSLDALRRLPNTREALKRIIGHGGIHDLRASTVECRLEEID